MLEEKDEGNSVIGKTTKSDPLQLEMDDHFILRLPLRKADYVRSLLHSKPRKLKKNLKIDLADFESGDGAAVTVRKHVLKASLVKLPTIIESYKTYDGISLFKTADICQILDCTTLCDETLVAPRRRHCHGLSAPLKNVKSKRFRQCQVNDRDEEQTDIQKEVYYLLKTDLEAVSTRFELIITDNSNNKKNSLPPLNGNNSNHQSTQLFGDISSSDDDSD